MAMTLRQERLQRLSDAMAEAGLDVLLVPGNAWRTDYLKFVTDATSLDGQAIAIHERGGDTRLVVENPGEDERLAVECPDLKVAWSPSPVAEALSYLGRHGNRRCAVAGRDVAPYALMSAPGAASLTDATGMLDRLMLKKSAAELDAMRRACALADDGYRAFMAAARPGRREYELVADTEAYFRNRGCPENFQILGSGGVEVRGMHPPGDRRLKKGDLVTTELTPCVEGYYAQICRTLVLGPPTAEQKKAHAIYLEALEAGIAAVRPGVTAADIARAENDVFRKYGLGDYVTSEYTRVRGHGLGLYVDGRPALLEDVDIEIEPDMTFIVHPNTYNPNVGYMVLGDTVRATATGCEVFTRTPRELFVREA
jgi:Xaa-Pro aminopeptidase